MSAEVVVGVASAAVSVVGAIAAGLMTTWSAQRTRRYENLLQAQQKAQSKAEQAEAILSRYREPLLGAAQNLHSRLYTMVEHDALAVHLHGSDADLERYARDYTIYVLAEYLCWAEIVRRDLRFLDLASEERNREFVRLLEVNQLALSNEAFPRPLRLYRGEQRAIGELMMIPAGDPASAQYESLGYVQFCTRLDDDPAFAKWFARLRDGLYQVANTEAERPQIASLQNGLIDLIEFLDPQQLRLPGRRRDRLTPSDNDIPATTTDLSHSESAARDRMEQVSWEDSGWCFAGSPWQILAVADRASGIAPIGMQLVKYVLHLRSNAGCPTRGAGCPHRDRRGSGAGSPPWRWPPDRSPQRSRGHRCQHDNGQRNVRRHHVLHNALPP